MVARYHAKAISARDKLKAKGGSGVFTIFTVNTDPVKQTSDRSVSSATIFYAVSQSTSRKQYAAKQVFGATALVDRKLDYLLVAGLGLPRQPQIGDEMTWAGFTWRVVYTNPINPAGDESLLYDVFIER